MEKYLIEVPHDAEKVACARTIQTFLNTGSHFLMNADWGCEEGVHKAWFVLELESKEEARAILPPAYRSQATIVKLNKFTLDQVDVVLSQHEN
jgi:hypothetical protein